MDQKILQSENPQNRVQCLQDSCVKSELFTYPRKLSKEELELEKHNYTKNAITVEVADKKLQLAKDIYKSETKPVKEEMQVQISKIKSGIEEMTESVYLMDNQEEGKMGYYNAKGILVYERKIMENEKQLRLVSLQTG